MTRKSCFEYSHVVFTLASANINRREIFVTHCDGSCNSLPRVVTPILEVAPMMGSGLEMRAAQYLRVSTDRQALSLENQAAAIYDYAVEHRLEIVRSYVDEGRSGLTLNGREGLQQLIADAHTRNLDFSVLLIYDISRWGRFQDMDAAAYYEYICRDAGLRVVYCVEPFTNDGSPLSDIVKGMKRLMAAEYSRELSEKTFAGHAQLARIGLKTGGSAGIGLRRQLEDADANPKYILRPREWKAISSDRVRLIRGPDSEIELVRRIYREALDGSTMKSIAGRLRRGGVETESGRPWTPAMVKTVLTSEKYIGRLIYNKRSKRLKTKPIWNDSSHWIEASAAYAPIICPEEFDRIQSKFKARRRRVDHKAAMSKLESLYQNFGYLSCSLIDRQPDMPNAEYFLYRYGSMAKAYAMVGYVPVIDTSYVERRRKRWPMRKAVLAEIVDGFSKVGVKTSVSCSGVVTIPSEGRILTRSASPIEDRRTGRLKWKLNVRGCGARDGLVVFVRMDLGVVKPFDFCFVRLSEFRAVEMMLYSAFEPVPGLWRRDTLEPLFVNAEAWLGAAPIEPL